MGVHSYICRPFLLGAGDPGFDLPASARFLKFRRFSFLLGVLDVFEIPEYKNVIRYFIYFYLLRMIILGFYLFDVN